MTPDCQVNFFDSPERNSPLLVTSDVHSAVLGVHGELDRCSAPVLLESVRCVLAQSECGGPLTVSLRRLSFLDSAGVQAVAESAQIAAEAGRPLLLVPPAERFIRVFELLGFAHLLRPASECEKRSSGPFVDRPAPPRTRVDAAMRRAEHATH